MPAGDHSARVRHIITSIATANLSGGHSAIGIEIIPFPADLSPTGDLAPGRIEIKPFGSLVIRETAPARCHSPAGIEVVQCIVDPIPVTRYHGSIRIEKVPVSSNLPPAGGHSPGGVHVVPVSTAVYPAGLHGGLLEDVPLAVDLPPAIPDQVAFGVVIVPVAVKRPPFTICCKSGGRQKGECQYKGKKQTQETSYFSRGQKPSFGRI